MTQVDPPPPNPADREWLKFKPDDKRPHIRYSRISSGAVTFDNLTHVERDAIEAFLNGSSYIRCVDGRLHAYSACKPLPEPIDDPVCGPHWAGSTEPKQFGGIPEGEGWHAPGIIITGLGVSCDNPTALRRNQEKVEDCGFICMRSKRSHCGRYWEQWILPYMSGAPGRLEEHMKSRKDLNWHQQAEEACRFLARDLGVRFGSMDITIQRWAMQHPD